MSETIESSEERAERMRLAERAFDARVQDAKSAHEQISSFSIAGMKAPALVAAGGVAALLGFYSANYTRLSQCPQNLETFNSILFWLFLALLMTVIAPGFAYFSQLAYLYSYGHEERHYSPPFIRDTRRSIRSERLGDTFRWLATLATITSIVFIMIGGYMFLRLF